MPRTHRLSTLVGPFFSSDLCRVSAALDYERHPKPFSNTHTGSRMCLGSFTLISRLIDRHGVLETPGFGSSDPENSHVTLRQYAVVFKAACHYDC